MRNKIGLFTAASTVAVVASLFFSGVVSAQYYPIFLYPIVEVVTPVENPTFDKTPNFTFKTSLAGDVSYSGDCSSSTNHADADVDVTVTFNTLSVGTHSNCVVTVANGSSATYRTDLEVPSFKVNEFIIYTPIELVAPTLTLVEGVTTMTDTTPTVKFDSNQTGTISYLGSCSSSDSTAVDGTNTITFNALSNGTYSDCKIKVTNISDNSATLNIPSFKILKLMVPPVLTYDTCADFSDVMESDADCAAITYVKSIGAMTGNANGTFGINDLLQRDQIAKVALETFNQYNDGSNYCDGSNPFPDVNSSAWSYQYICRAKALALVTGYSSGADKGFFRPSRSVNRAEFLAILLRNFSDDLTSGSSYVDVNAGDWFNSYAKFSKDNGLFTGSAFNAGNLTTRREVAKVIYKLHNLGKI